ncbi:MAG: hypothetical protein JNM84_22495 [Planctomycetes bacterium]|nr:hypothetical protein [Planctomycetota bacterium]
MDEGTPSGLESLLHGARLGSPAVDADAATLVARLEPKRWEALTEAARGAWLARAERVASSDETNVSLRFHFVRDGARWLLDLRAARVPR